MAQEYAEKLSYRNLQSLYDDEQLYSSNDRKWLKRCVLCLAVINPFDVGYHLECCRNSYVHEACRLGPSASYGERDPSLGVVNRRAGKRFMRRQLTFNGKRCPSCRQNDAHLVKFTDHLQYMDRMTVTCPVEGCDSKMTAVDFLQHYATCSGERWFAVDRQQAVVRRSERLQEADRVPEQAEEVNNPIDLDTYQFELLPDDNELDIVGQRLAQFLVGLDQINNENETVDRSETRDEPVEDGTETLNDVVTDQTDREIDLDNEVREFLDDEDQPQMEDVAHDSDLEILEELADMPEDEPVDDGSESDHEEEVEVDVDGEFMRLVQMCHDGYSPTYDSEQDNEDERLAWHLQNQEMHELV